MNFPFFRPKPAQSLPHVVVRHVVATKAESAAARQKRADVQLELAVYAAITTQAQRKAEADAFHEQFTREWPKLRASRRPS